MKKYIVSFAILGSLLVPAVSFGATLEELQAMLQSILAQIAQLQAEQGGVQAWCHTFSKDLKIGSSGSEVDFLVEALTREGITSWKGDSNNVDGFDEAVASAVTGFQEKYKSEILTPAGLKYGTGYVGARTRAKLNKLYGCGIIRPVPKAPVITSIQSVSNPPGVVDAGKKASIYGFGLSGKLTVKIGNEEPYRIQTEGVSDTYAEFLVPMYEQPVVRSVTVTNSSGLTSNSYEIKIQTSTSQTPSITVLSPNGGEQWQVGSTQTIRWNNLGNNSGTVSIILFDQSSNMVNATIATAASNIGSFNWVIPSNILPGSYKVEVYLTNGTYDLSDAPFTITAPGTTTTSYSTYFLSPVAGEVLRPGQRYGIRWGIQPAYSNDGTMASIDVVTAGGEVLPIMQNVPASQGFYNWRVFENLNANSAHTIRITFVGGNTSLTGRTITSGAFTVSSSAPLGQVSPLQVTAPIGGKSWLAGSNQTIHWTGGGTGWVIMANLLDAATKNIVVKTIPVWGIATGSPNIGSQQWAIPSDIPTGNYVIRLECQGCPVGVSGTSADSGVFSIGTTGVVPPSSITVTSPNGGEQWQLGSSHTILWTPYDPQTNLNTYPTVQAYLDRLVNGTFIEVGKIVPAGKASIHWEGEINGYGQYPTPGDYYVRLVNSATGVSDRSNAPFKLIAKGTLKADLKVNGSDGSITVASDAKPIAMAVSWNSNADSCTIYNQTAQTDTEMQISNLPPAGDRVINIYPNFNSYTLAINLWCTAKIPEGQASDNVIVLTTNQAVSSILILSPNGGEQIDLNSKYTIKFRHTTDVNRVSLILYKNDASFRTVIADMGVYSVENGYVWDPSTTLTPLELSNTSGQIYKIYAIGYKSSGGTVTDMSDAPFTITSGTTQTQPLITGTTAKAAGNFEVDAGGSASILGSNFLGDYPSATKVFIGGMQATVVSATDSMIGIIVPSSLSAGQTYELYVSNGRGTSNIVKVKILSSVSTTPSITVLSPNGGEQWHPGETRRISWSSTGVSTVKIYVYDSNISGSGSTLYVTPNTVSTSITGGYFDWTIGSFGSVGGAPGTGGSNYRIRVDDATTSGLSDSSDFPFSIISPTTISYNTYFLNPAGGETLTSGSSYKIVWGIQPAYFNTTTGAAIKLIGDNGASYAIANTLATNGYYYWTIPSVSQLPISSSGKYTMQIMFDTNSPLQGKVITSQPFTISTLIASSPSLSVSISSTVQAKTISPGGISIPVASYTFDAIRSSDDIKLTSIPLKYTTLSTPNDLFNCNLYSASPVALLSNTITPLPNHPYGGYVTFTGEGFTVRRGTSVDAILRCSISGSAVSGKTYNWGLVNMPFGAVGVLTGSSVTVAVTPSSGPTVTITGSVGVGTDLSVKNLQLTTTGVQAVFCNSGTATIADFPLNITLNGVVRSFNLAGLTTQGACRTDVWTYGVWNSALTYQIPLTASVVVDPANKYTESNELNNTVAMSNTASGGTQSDVSGLANTLEAVKSAILQLQGLFGGNP